MDIQSKKLHFVQEFLRLRDEKLIDKLSEMLKMERRKKLKEELKPFSKNEFNVMIDRAEQDSLNGKLTSAKELKNEIETWD